MKTNLLSRWFRLESHQHALGWFLLTVGALGTAGDLYYYNIANIPYLIVLGVGLWLIVRSANLFEESETKKQLREHHRLHHLEHAADHHQTLIANTPPVISTVQVLLIVLGVAALSVGLFLLYQVQPTWFFFVLFATNVPLFALFFRRHTAAWLLMSGSLTLATVLQAIRSLQQFPSADPMATFLMVGAICIAALAVITCSKQRHDNYRLIGFSLFLYSLAYITSWTALSGLEVRLSFEVALLSWAAISAIACMFAWMRVQRFSFAKYLGLVALISVVSYVYLFWSSDAVTATWLACGLVALFAGFLLPSYSMRMLGLGCVGVGVLYYLLIVTAEPLVVDGAWWTHPQVWLGLATILISFLSWWWYGLIKIQGKEARLYPALRAGLMTAAIGSALALMFTQLTDGWVKIVVTIAVSLAMMMGAQLYRNAATFVTGILLFAYGVLQLIVYFPNASDTSRLLLFLALAILLLPGSIFLTHRS